MLEEVTTQFIFQFMLIFSRFAAAFSLFPALSDNLIPMRIKVAIVATVTLVMHPAIVQYLPVLKGSLLYNVSIMFIEIITGFIVAISAKLYFAALNTVGHIISMQSGLGSATFFDPAQRTQTAVFSNMLTFFGVVAIFVTDTHYLFIQSIIDSYVRFPPGQLLEIADMSKFVTHIVNDSFLLAFKIASPFIILSLVMLVGSGLLSRLMPNLQVFFVITPAQILVMFIVVYVLINIIIEKIIAVLQDSLAITYF